MHVDKVLARVLLAPERFEDAVRFYEQQLGEDADPRFRWDGVDLAQVGQVLILAAEDERLALLRQTAMSWVVPDLDQARADLSGTGSVIERAPREVRGARNMLVRHPDGVLVEYVEVPAHPAARGGATGGQRRRLHPDA